MALPVYQYTGQMRVALAVKNTVELVCVLFTNNRVPAVSDTLGLYTEADFSGYARPPAMTWGLIDVQNQRARMQSTQMTWTHNGGPTDNLVFGVAVVDDDGELFYVERDPRGPQWITASNPVYTYTAVFTDTTEFTG